MSVTRPREVRLRASDIPDRGVAMVSIGHHRIGVMRVGGQLHALADRCPHRGAPLCSFGEIVTEIERLPDGTLALGEPGTLIRCPWHKWDFDIATGTSPADPAMRVRRYAVQEDGDEVVVWLDRPEQ
jgi:3-phenylpropionate/trans-cinnamate dioxygenase ferredoxin subunit